MEHSAILQPVVVLIGWSIVMWAWMIGTRIPAMSAKGIKLGKLTGGKGSDADGILPDRAQWKAHNYNHLHEAPTLFYAVALVLAIVGQGDGLNATIAWVYVALRVLHSIWQATVNRIPVRLLLFGLSTLCLIALAVRAIELTVFA